MYFAYGQHGFLPDLEARLPAQHVMGESAEEVHRTFLLRRRYFELLDQTVVGLFAGAKAFAESKYGHELEARAHATWAAKPHLRFLGARRACPRTRTSTNTPPISSGRTRSIRPPPPVMIISCGMTFSPAAATTMPRADGRIAITIGVALACSTGILNRTPYAYAAAWGMPNEVLQRHQAVCDTFGAAANPWFQAVQDSQHRDTDVLDAVSAVARRV